MGRPVAESFGDLEGLFAGKPCSYSPVSFTDCVYTTIL